MKPFRLHALVAVILAVLGMLAIVWLTGGKNTLPVWLCSWLLSVNLVSFGYYGFDKARARSNRRRVPELVLHGLSVLGGSPGAYLGMRIFRHKTIKGKFRILFWCIVLLQATLAVWLAKSIWWT